MSNITDQMIHEMYTAKELLLDSAEETAAEEVAHRYGVDPDDLQEEFQERGEV